MKIQVGTEIQSDFGTGEVVSITKDWVIQRTEDGEEYALSRSDSEYWIPATSHELGGGDNEIDVEKLVAFKEYIHMRLDEAGVPSDPDPERTRETGCRIGTRIDWVVARMRTPQ